ncbi:MAG: UDP-N-acetylmuramoyl-tripeptide--D-alanyl-D-alanine ligase [Candidatus Margulisiibacteriota bacterium]
MNSIKGIHERFLNCSGVSIDSRTVEQGNCFFAIRGPNFDGNQYAQDALKKGAKLVVVDDESVVTSHKFILVNNTLKTLQALANFHRNQFPNLSVLVIAGSNGKTTTKELLATVLSCSKNVLATKGNLNNHLGVPLTLLNINKNHDIALIEMGANHINEHKLLCDIANPNFALVTNCGKDHLEGYGSIEGVIQSNKEVYEYINQVNGIKFVPSDDRTLTSISNKSNCIYFGNNKNYKNTIELIRLSGSANICINLKSASDQIISIQSKLYGKYNGQNILAAFTIGNYFDIPWPKMKRALEAYEPTNNRSQKLIWRKAMVYLDAYNANPSSMSEFLKFINNEPSDNKLIILGAMEELGRDSNQEHLKLITQLQKVSYSDLILIGPGFEPYISNLKCNYFNTIQDIQTILEAKELSGWAVFVKGSRKYTLEKIFNL